MNDNKGGVVLGYWKIRGLAEKIRMVLEYVGIPYTENKYNADNENKWFSEEKPEYIKKNPAANLPYLIDGDRFISESDAIIVYAIHKAKKTELLGRNAEEQVLAATTIGIYRDYHKKYVALVYGSKENFANKEQKTAEWNTELTKLNALLEGKEYFCGQITWVDFVVAENMQAVGLLDSKILEPFPNIVNHQKRIWELP